MKQWVNEVQLRLLADGYFASKKRIAERIRLHPLYLNGKRKRGQPQETKH
jgi:hypothetical protein